MPASSAGPKASTADNTLLSKWASPFGSPLESHERVNNVCPDCGSWVQRPTSVNTSVDEPWGTGSIGSVTMSGIVRLVVAHSRSSSASVGTASAGSCTDGLSQPTVRRVRNGSLGLRGDGARFGASSPGSSASR